MRLIETSTLQLKDFIGLEIPQYAILSHTWGTDEVTLQEFTSPVKGTKSKKGYHKIQRAYSLAQSESLDYAWVDTCCIDKTSSAELTESINSMFEWYKRSTVCYTYLSDIPPRAPSAKDTLTDEELGACRWFTRGWTLQELIAPEHLVFFDQDWNPRGTKESLVHVLSKITGVDEGVLRDRERMASQSVAMKMSWASARETTRFEDTAYCLLGIFNVNMPLFYGEAENAFTRLQHEILKSSTDLSIFGWCTELTPLLKTQDTPAPSNEHYQDGYYSILAPSPKEFGASKLTVETTSLLEYTVTNLGIRIDCSLLELCMNECEPLSRCHCNPESRKYLFDIPSRAYQTKLFPKGWGVLLEKVEPDYFIRSSSRLIHTYLSGAGMRRTRRRPIYFETAPPRFEPTVLDVLRPIGVQAPSLEIDLVAPESGWDFSKRCFLTRWTSNEQPWGLVEFRIPKERLQYASHDIGFCVLFEFYSRDILILDDHKLNKSTGAIFRDGENWMFREVFEHLYSSGDMRQKICRERVMREFAFLDRWQSIKYRKKVRVVANISEAGYGRWSLMLTVNWGVVSWNSSLRVADK